MVLTFRSALSRRILQSRWVCKRCLSTGNLPPARTRFAPSPTGKLHLGSLRTALYNYLWARRTGGQFILRVEDTDQNRLSEGAERSLFDNLKWAGLDIDEGPQEGGPHRPYRQSERLSIYRDHIQVLLDNGSAYRCFCDSDRLESLREASRKQGHSGTYDRKCFHMSAETASEKVQAQGQGSFVVRLRSPDVAPVVEDMVHGTVTFPRTKQHLTYDDAILMKSDGYPTYHFANVVDDHLMGITHVIRGEEWLPSTPKHLAIYAAFNWTPPQFAHVPLLASVGGAKLSKRHGDTTVEAYREKGILPESMLNYLALMGWNAQIASGDTEVMTIDQMAERFDLTQITKGAAIVTPEKLWFLQKQHYLRLSESTDGMARLVTQTQAELAKTYQEEFSNEYVEKVILALKDRIVDPLGVPQLGGYFFQRPDYAKTEAVKFKTKFEKRSSDSLAKVLGLIHEGLEKLDEDHWTGTEFNLKIEQFFNELDAPNNTVMGAIRYAIAGGQSGAGVKQIMSIIGREETLHRIKEAQIYSQ